MSRTIVYIDGFNLYYRALKGTSHKWLDIAALSAAVLPPPCQILAINYYTAHVSGRLDPTAPARQHAYLRALQTLQNVSIHHGNFLVSQKWSGLVQPPDFKPTFPLPAGAAPQVAYVWKTEEKGSDVNLGVHLVRDAFVGKFDEAAELPYQLEPLHGPGRRAGGFDVDIAAIAVRQAPDRRERVFLAGIDRDVGTVAAGEREPLVHHVDGDELLRRPQPSVTRTIQDLEAELGFQLLHRVVGKTFGVFGNRALRDVFPARLHRRHLRRA